ncbi:MAG: YgiQ family radical SAM protein [Nitrospinae bacterium]|nr:YgiQ family radical SAM protein [Nitrospinota bacterium]
MNPIPFLPTTPADVAARGWDALDVILVTGDAYIDHPSFGAALVGRYLESLGVRVGLIAAPAMDNPDDFTRLGRPRWFFGVTAGALDSMIMRYTAARKPRSDDDYVPGGQAGRRPARAVIAYCNRLRELFDNPPLVIGGVEASMRRFAHYDYWDHKVRRSLLLDSRADLLVYGMGERPLKALVARLEAGEPLGEIVDLPGTAVVVKEPPAGEESVLLPSADTVAKDKEAYAVASKLIHRNQNPGCAKTLVQPHGNRFVRVNPPAAPLTTEEMDALYALSFVRAPHPSYVEPIPAFEMIRFSVTAMRGCFGGCAFCALTVHQGRHVSSRSTESIVDEIAAMTRLPGFTGHVSDIGGPTANMYMMRCDDPAVEALCRKESCVWPSVCSRLVADHGPLIETLRAARQVPGVKKVFVGSGVRYDLALLSPEYIRELAAHHVSGQLKVAPEHVDPAVLKAMRKPPIETYDRFASDFLTASKQAGKEQYLIPYFIASHPGCGLPEQVKLAEYLHSRNIRPRQVQDFIPAPMTLAADMYWSGVDPMSGQPLSVTADEKGRRLQRALMQYFKPENRQDVAQACAAAGRSDLVGFGKKKLAPPVPPGGYKNGPSPAPRHDRRPPKKGPKP